MPRERLTRQESRLRTRERLLEAAAEVFSRSGFHAASIDEIAEEAGFSKGAVYSNFASKEELFMTLLDRHLETELQNVTFQFMPKKSAEEREGMQPHRYFAATLEEKQTWNILSIEFSLYAMRHPLVQRQLAERYHTARNEITTLLQGMYQARASTPPFPVEYIAWTLLALGTGLALQAYLEPGAIPAELYATIVGQLLDTPL
jgi:AcrR family transcriptional regulator